MMLRKRSRGTSEQALMADFTSTEISRNPISSIFGSPRLFNGIASKTLIESESLQSPTSILDSKPFSILKKPFWSDSKTSKSPNPNFIDSRKVGLGIVDEESDPKLSKPETRMVVFGSQLKIQIPPLPQSSVLSQTPSPNSPPEFGIKTRKSFGSGNPGLESSVSPRIFISASEMELSEEYTRVITHGPNPKTTHIFDDCIVESCCGVVGVCGEKRERNGFGSLRYPSESFLSFCYTCNKSLGQGKDIYMYRGEKAFCSSECRYKGDGVGRGNGDGGGVRPGRCFRGLLQRILKPKFSKSGHDRSSRC